MTRDQAIKWLPAIIAHAAGQQIQHRCNSNESFRPVSGKDLLNCTADDAEYRPVNMALWGVDLGTIADELVRRQTAPKPLAPERPIIGVLPWKAHQVPAFIGGFGGFVARRGNISGDKAHRIVGGTDKFILIELGGGEIGKLQFDIAADLWQYSPTAGPAWTPAGNY